MVLLALGFAGCDEPRGRWVAVPEAAGGPADDVPSVLEGADDLSPGWSAVLVGAFLDLPFGAVALAALSLALLHRRRARAERAFDPAAPLRDGPSVIAGVVELDAGTEPPVVVRIEQTGREHTAKNGPMHTWTETGRTVVAVPFLVRRDDGTRVRVEPDERVVLHGSLTRTERKALAQRARVAQIEPGEHVHVHGELVGAVREQRGGTYRGSAAMPALRASRLAPLVISSEPPADTEAALARFHAPASALLAVVFVLASALLAPAFQLLSLDGRVVEARPTQTRTWQEWVKPKGEPGGWVQKYAVRAEARSPSGETLSLESTCSEQVHACASTGRCRTLPFLTSRISPSTHQIGTRPRVTHPEWLFMLILAWGLGWLYPSQALSRRPWYARRRLVESGAGSLQSTMDAE